MKRRISFLCLFVHFSLAISEETTAQERIGEFPYFAILRDSFLKKGAYKCGAAIVGKFHVVTAAHCAWNPFLQTSDVTRNTLVVTGDGDVRKLRNIFLHPNFSAISGTHDVAVLELSEGIDFNDLAKPVNLPTERGYQNGAKADLISCGTSQNVRKTVLEIVSSEECELEIERLKKYLGEVEGLDNGFSANTDGKICAAGPRSSVCAGDSGSPLVLNDTLIGVLAFGDPDCQHRIPYGFTAVHSYLAFITGILRNETTVEL